MEGPNVKHPTTFRIKGVYFEVFAYVPLTTQQAAMIARLHAAKLKITKRDVGKTIQIRSLVDENSVGLL